MRKAYTLITGASFGLGAAFARALAARGHNLILTARSQDRLEALRGEVEREGVEVRCVGADLARGGAAEVAEHTRRHGLAVNLLINNAGLGSAGDFAALRLDRELEMVSVNAAAMVEMTHAFLGGMLERGAGAIVQVASTAGFQPVPTMATYAATKAFVLHFSLALWEENARHGVHVMALCPGPTETHFFEAAGTHPRGGRVRSAETVVAEALAGLEARRPVVVCGGNNRRMIAMERWVPRLALVKLVGRVMRRRL